MIRPEVRTLAWRWREALIGVALVAAGLWLVTQPATLIKGLGALVGVAGVAMAVNGARRARFMAPAFGSGAAPGPGVVQVVEGQIAWFAPGTDGAGSQASGMGGGFIALDEITQLSLSADGRRWVVMGPGGQHLAMPINALGAEALFDAFATLPGLDMAHLTRMAAAGPGARARPVWRRNAAAALLT
ncbi:MAG: hypothetical protein ACXIVG_03035 [Pararhodobacter sp.]